MAVQKRSPKSWTHYLGDDEGQYTLEEYQAGCLSKILGAVIAIAQATGHTEGMVGSLDELMHATNPDYRAIADRRARPVPPELPGG